GLVVEAPGLVDLASLEGEVRDALGGGVAHAAGERLVARERRQGRPRLLAEALALAAAREPEAGGAARRIELEGASVVAPRLEVVALVDGAASEGEGLVDVVRAAPEEHAGPLEALLGGGHGRLVERNRIEHRPPAGFELGPVGTGELAQLAAPVPGAHHL